VNDLQAALAEALRGGFNKVGRVLARHDKDIGILKRQISAKPVPAGAPITLLSRLGDVTGIKYTPEDEAPPHGSVIVLDTTVDNKTKAAWSPRGGAIIENIFTETATGDLIIEEALADSADWSEFTQWMVTVTASVGGTFSAPAADDLTLTIPVGTTITVGAGATATGVEIDGDPGVTVVFGNEWTFDVPTGGEIQFDHPADTWGIAKPLPTGLVRLIPEGGLTVDHPEPAYLPLGINNTGQLAGTTGWLYAGGIPYVQVAIDIDSAVYSGDHTLTVIARAWPVPTLTQPTP